MTSAGGFLTTNLSAIANCVNKCNCCASLQQQINELKSQVNAVKAVDENSIINRAVAKSEAAIIPKIPTEFIISSIAGTVAQRAVQPVKAKADLSLEKAFKNEVAARQAKNTASAARGVANNNASKIASLLARFASIAATLAGLAASVAVLKVLSGRINGLERYVDSIGADLSKALGLIGLNRSNISKLGNELKAVGEKATDALLTAARADGKAERADGKAGRAETKANEADKKAGQALQGAQQANQKADNAINQAKNANQKADQAVGTATTAKNTAEAAQRQSSSALSKADQAFNQALTANDKADVAIKTAAVAPQALQVATTANDKAETANQRAASAESFAGRALNIAQSAQTIAQNVAAAIPGITNRLNILGSTIPGLRRDININSTELAKLKEILRNLKPGEIPPNLTNEINKIKRDLTIVNSGVTRALIGNQANSNAIQSLKEQGASVDSQTKALIETISRDVKKIPPLFVPIAAGVAAIPKGTEFINKVGEGTCKTLNTSGCTNKLRNDIGRDRTAANNNLLGKITAASTGANNALNAQILTQVNTINTKMGAQLPGGLAGTFGRLWGLLQVDRVFNILNFLVGLHNAAMLSQNVAQTLGATLDAGANLLGFKIKNEKNEDVTLTQSISNVFNSAINNIFGAANVRAFYARIAAANRIYQSATNMLSDIQGMFDSGRQIAELTANNTGKIGNALKKAGAIYENAFDWMNEKNTAASAKQKAWDRVIDGIQSADDKISNFNSVISEIQSVQDNLKQLKDSRKEFEESVKQGRNSISTEAGREKGLSELKSNITDQSLSRANA